MLIPERHESMVRAHEEILADAALHPPPAGSRSTASGGEPPARPPAPGDAHPGLKSEQQYLVESPNEVVVGV